MSEKLKRFESLAVEQRIVRKEVCRIMKDLEMIDREHHCSCSSKGAFNKWRGSKLKTGKGHIFFSPIVAGLRNQSSQEPAENDKGIHILINIRNILCWHSIVPTVYHRLRRSAKIYYKHHALLCMNVFVVFGI